MDPLSYEILSWLAAGNRVFQPRESTADAEQEFREVVAKLRQLREQGLVSYLEGHVSMTSGGIYLAVGPVLLTPAGEAVLARDRELGERPEAQSYDRPWRR